MLFGITLSASSGQAVERICPAFIQFVSTRAIRDVCGLPFDWRHLVHEDGGASWVLRGDGMRAEYAPPEQTMTGRPRCPSAGAMSGSTAHVGTTP